mgnify:CR=1 FL=1
MNKKHSLIEKEISEKKNIIRISDAVLRRLSLSK